MKCGVNLPDDIVGDWEGVLKQLRARFNGSDENHDGRVDLAEFVTLANKVRAA
ncbi:hypothetical protein ACFCXT_14720 [Streptomyces vinaceus]|uniref:hypothetical protein n=1 Tax=Streptomyces vinaceus TaxID=1960 RepID=UPI0035DF56BF